MYALLQMGPIIMEDDEVRNKRVVSCCPFLLRSCQDMKMNEWMDGWICKQKMIFLFFSFLFLLSNKKIQCWLTGNYVGKKKSRCSFKDFKLDCKNKDIETKNQHLVKLTALYHRYKIRILLVRMNKTKTNTFPKKLALWIFSE